MFSGHACLHAGSDEGGCQVAKIDLNSASEHELQAIEGIDVERARQIARARAKKGRFSSWEDLTEIAGISDVLLSKIQQRATLGDLSNKASARAGSGKRTGNGQGPPKAPSTRKAEERGETADREDLEGLRETAAALAQMDLEAAAAYDIAAAILDDIPEVAKKLRAFAEDHRRHVTGLGQLLERRGLEPSAVAPDPDTATLALLTSAMGALGTKPALLALLSSEQLTNAAYEAAIELAVHEDARALFERHLEDEQRHLRWIAEHRDREFEHGSTVRRRSERPGR